jgi:tetratricopeptide (TPR) repeat protein
MNDTLAQTAISAALSGNWQKCLEVNKFILKKDPENIDAANRLARAYSELGNITMARKMARKVLSIDPFNSIAQKALEKWKGLKQGDTYVSRPSGAQVFLEEPGKTKIVSLLHLGSPKTLAKLDSGDEIKLNTASHRVSLITKNGTYIGRLPDDLSVHLKKLIKRGNEYQVFIKSIDKEQVKVFIRESKRAKKLAHIPSFSTDKIEYVSFTPPGSIRQNEATDKKETEEEEE